MDFTLTEEQRQMQDMARAFARNEIAPVAHEYDERAEFPHPIVDKARELGLVNMNTPQEYGGIGAGAMDTAVVMQELAWGCAGISVCIGLNSLAGDALLVSGTEAQKQKYFARLSESFGAYALTEPGAGSDAAAITTRAERRNGGYVINGRKTWISHAPQAGFFVVFAVTEPGIGHAGISAFLVDREVPGVEVSNPLPKMGQKASPCAEVSFDDVEVPEESRLGPEGDGFKIAMRVFDRSRPMVASFAVGVAQRALDEAVNYARERKAFGRPIVQFQGIGFKIAEIGMRTEAARLLTYQASWKIDHGIKNSLDAAYAKAFAADTAMFATVEAVQVLGGYGYSKEYPVEKLMRDAKVLQIYEGTSEIQRTIMVRELTR